MGEFMKFMKINKEKLMNLDKKKSTKNIWSIVTPLCLTIVVLGVIINISNKVNNPYGVQDVVVAKKEVKQGTIIDKNNVESYFRINSSTDKSVVPKDSLTNLKSLEGKIIESGLSENEIATNKDTIGVDSVLSQISNPREVSIELNSIGEGVGGLLRQGDIVDILIKDDNLKESSEVLRHVYIDKALTASGSEIKRDDKTSAEILNVIIDKKDVKVLESAKQKGNISISKIK